MTSTPKYYIQSDLLYELLTYGDGLTVKYLNIGSNWSTGEHIWIAKGVLTWLAEQAFNVRRLPWSPDSIFMKGWSDNYDAQKAMTAVWYKLEQLTHNNPIAITNAIQELSTIRSSHINWLKKHPKLSERIANINGVEYMKLGRAYLDKKTNISSGFNRYATRLLEMKKATDFLLTSGHSASNEIPVPHDLLTSWSSIASYPKRSVEVNTLIPLTDILCSAEFIASRGKSNAAAIETGEWIVLTTTNNGIRYIPSGDIAPSSGYQAVGFPKLNCIKNCEDLLKEGFPLMNEYHSEHHKETKHNSGCLKPDSIKNRIFTAVKLIIKPDSL